MPPRRHTAARANPRAAVVRACRAYAYFSIAELAEHLDVSTSTINRWEAGDWLPADDQVEAVAAVCGIPAWRMLLDDGDALALDAHDLARRAADLRDALGFRGDDAFGDANQNPASGVADDRI